MAQLPLRPARGRLLVGVCAAVSDALAMDVTLVRLAFVLLALAWGIGLLVYAALWLLLPDERQPVSGSWGTNARHNVGRLRDDVASSGRWLADGWRRIDRNAWPRPLDRRWLAVGLLAIGLLVFLAALGAFDWLTPTRALGLAIAGLGAALLITLRG